MRNEMKRRMKFNLKNVVKVIAKCTMSLALMFFVQNASAQLNSDRLQLSYEECTGSLVVKVRVLRNADESCADLDRLMHVELNYVDGANDVPLLYLYSKSNGAEVSLGLVKEITFDQINPIYSNIDASYQGPANGNCAAYNFGYVAPAGSSFSWSGNKADLATLKIPLLDNNLNSSLSIKVEGAWRECVAHLGGCNPGLGYNTTYYSNGTYQVSSIEPKQSTFKNSTIQNFQASTDQCSEINLTWTERTDVPTSDCSFSDRGLLIEYRNLDAPSGSATANWRNIQSSNTTPIPNGDGLFPYDMSSITFNPFIGSQPDDQWEFRMRHVYEQNAYRTFESNYSNSTGNYLLPPAEATNLRAPIESCDNVIKVEWDYGLSTGLQGFQILRRVKGVGSFVPVNTGLVPAGDRFYDDSGGSANVLYEYQIVAIDICTRTSTSDVVEGSKLGAPSAPYGVVTSKVNNGTIRVGWGSNGLFLKNFVIERTGDGSLTRYPNISPTLRFYNDDNIQQCVNYTYTVKAVSDCDDDNGGVGNASSSFIITPNLDNAFDADGLDASKGYHTDKVQLDWTNNNANQTNAIKIYRKILGSSVDSSLLTTLNAGSGTYNDESADAGILYEYEIVAEGPCDTSIISSNRVKSIGFRSKSGIVNGKVTYEGGIAVEDVKIKAERGELLAGKSLEINGNHLRIEHNSNQELGNEFLMETWIKPQNHSSGPFGVIRKQGTFTLEFDGSSTYWATIFHSSGIPAAVSISKDLISTTDWSHIAAQLRNDSLMIYVNGNLEGTTVIGSLVDIDDSAQAILLGSSLQGCIKEVRIWNQSKSDKLLDRDANRYISNETAGLIVLLHMNEGFGTFAYDLSKSAPAIFNRNHAEFIGNVMWSDNIPTGSQLAYAAFTDTLGNYKLNLPYINAGENYTLTPILFPHKFDPTDRVLFVGDASSVINGIDFTDISSFRVTGFLYYDGTTCPVEDAFVKIDNEVVVQDNLPIKTNSDGFFEIQVPIGEHFITVEKTKHEFSEGRFPPLGLFPGDKFDFQEPRGPLFFMDSTKVKVVGRIVGGLREGNKEPGLGLSINNIGNAQVVFKSNLGVCPNITATTVDTSGEYVAYLPPLEYAPEVTMLPSNPTIVFGDNGILDEVDYVTIPEEKTARYFVENAAGDTIRIDSTNYHDRQDFIFIDPEPTILVLDPNGVDPFRGDTALFFTNPMDGSPDTLKLLQEPLEWPVFSQATERYQVLIKVFEEYTNQNTGALDTVPTTNGELIFDNQLSEEDSLYNGMQLEAITKVELSKINTIDTLRSLLYQFTPGTPSFSKNEANPELSYTKTFNIELKTDKGIVAKWRPNSPIGSLPGLFRAYIFGVTQNGDQFITNGPEMPEYILRDPPGSGSSASREVGTTKTDDISWNWSLGTGFSAVDEIDVGVQFASGIGYEVETQTTNENTFSFDASIKGGRSGSIQQSFTTSEGVSTSTSNQTPGAGSDVYIGKSMNIQFGIARKLTVAPSSEDGISVTCLVPSGPNHCIVESERLAIRPEGYDTYFAYTETHIVNNLLPEIIQARDALFQPPQYMSKLGVADENYAKNNDDIAFGLPFPCGTGELCPALFDGISYKWDNMGDTSLIDTVRFLNNQINLWERAIARNEWEKIFIDNQPLIDTLRSNELKKLQEDNAGLVAAFLALSSGTAISGFVGSLAAIATPGGPAIGYAVFAVTSALGIANAEVEVKYREYEDEIERVKKKYDDLGATNYSFEAGAPRTFSSSHSTATSYSTSIEYQFSAATNAKFTATVAGNGTAFQRGIKLDYGSARNWGESESTTETVSYTLVDNEIGDFMSVDVYPSIYGWGPIFKKKAGGYTSCPHEPAEFSKYFQKYYNADGSEKVPTDPIDIPMQLSEGTLQIDKPEMSVSPGAEIPITNIPADQPAIFNLTLKNSTEYIYNREYRFQLVSSSNPDGAIARVDGSVSGTTLVLAPDEEVNKILTINKGPGPVYKYDSLLFIFYAPCQYESGTGFNRDIADSIYVSAEFIPTCTDVTLANPDNQWVVNNNFNDTLSVEISDYNYNDQTLERLRLLYKPADEPGYRGLESFWKNPTDPDLMAIPTSTEFIRYDWDLKSLDDGLYDIQVLSNCTNADNESAVHRGYIDRINPHAFGSPSPADGILDPNDDILLTMNETVEVGSINDANFDVRGVLNGTVLDHATSLSLSGATTYGEIPEYQLQKRTMSVEFWVKRSTTGMESVVSQGVNSSDQLNIYFDNTDHVNFQLGNSLLTSDTIVNDNRWHHIVAVYDRENNNAELFIDFSLDNSDNNFNSEYSSTGAIFIGKDAGNNKPNFSGFIHELRLWNIVRTESQISSRALISLSGREAGLIGNWPLNEGYGPIGFDKVRSRHAQLTGSSWSILPQNHSFAFSDTSYLVADTAGTLAYSNEADLTFEAWFKTESNISQSIFSNGKADGTRPEEEAWNVYLDPAGAVNVENDGNKISSPAGYNDNKWHHVAAVIERTKSVSIYIDGQLVTTGNASVYKDFGGPKIWVGCRGWFEGSVEQRDQYFQGSLDDIRIWNVARKPEQVSRDFIHQMTGDELGLMAYYPFDGVVEVLGDLLRTPDLMDASINDSLFYHLKLGVGTTEEFRTDAPPVKLPRLIQQIVVTYSINDDQIFLDFTDPPERLENVTLDITVKNIKDLAGNKMESPETWIAYVDKNQVFWEEEYFKFEKYLEDDLTFTAKIKNNGGSQESFTIGNLPSWLMASPASGLIDPNSSVEVTFSVISLLNIGEYEQEVHVATESFGFNEKLLIDLKVKVDPPDWTVDPNDFSHSMNIVGQLEINDIISTDLEDMVSVWVDGELRGTANVEYDAPSGKNLVFLNILSDTTCCEILEFRAWDASRGRILVDLLPLNLELAAPGVLGSRTNPLAIEAFVQTKLTYVLNEGWNWISFPLAADSLSSMNHTLRDLSPAIDDEVKYLGQFNSYDGNGWMGVVPGFNTNHGFKIRVSEPDTFCYEGNFQDPAADPIDIVDGWNWIGVKSEFIVDVASALASLDPEDGTIIKGQRGFAIYESGFGGWGGNLDFLEPQKGYMLEYHKDDQLIFQADLNLRSSENVRLKSRSQRGKNYKKLEKSIGYEEGTYASTMSLTAEISNCIALQSNGSAIDLSQWSLASFAGGECRGVIESNWIESIGKYLFYLSIEGDRKTELSFKLVHNSNGSEIVLEQKIDYANNQVNGTSLSPYLFTCVATQPCDDTRMFRTVDVDMDQQETVERAAMHFHSDAILPHSRRYRFSAGNSIEFTIGFEVENGAELRAYIENCLTSNN